MRSMYEGPHTREISFPLGGIGSGSIGLAGNGRLVDWEIFNRPNKRSFNGFSHFAVKAERDGDVIDARVLNGDLQSPYVGQPIRGGPLHSGFGFGPDSQTLAGMPHFSEVTFKGQFPIAELKFEEPAFPGDVRLTAFNPFIPLQEDDSSLPVALFEWELKNTETSPITYTVCLSAGNPYSTEKVDYRYNQIENESFLPVHAIQLGSNQYASEHVHNGNITIATDAEQVSYQEYWYRGGWCDNIEMFWHDFTQPGALSNRRYSEDERPASNRDTASLAARFELLPGCRKTVRFAIGWYYPNVENHWNPNPSGPNGWRNYYASLFNDSKECAAYALRNWKRFYSETKQYKDALFSSTVPEVVIEAASANLSVLKSATVLRLEGGFFYGFEGCIEDIGCCEGSCTHVWNYAYALPFLFPRLERSMRNLDYTYNQRDDGRMSFRLMLPVGRERMDYRACADGQFGGVIKAYRDWKISGDTVWLQSIWPAIKASINYAWAGTNEDRWDPEQSGVLTGRQHHTLDTELFGPNAWLTGFYLAALKAGAEMASVLGESETADVYNHIYSKGKKWVDTHLFNGDYYAQRIDLSDHSLISRFGDEALHFYWNEELGQIKYQIADGCGIDQVAAQWHANLCGLGEIFDRDQTRTALRSLYTHNFKSSLRHEANTWRIFALNNEGGLQICTWPTPGSRPAIPLTYSSETMTGFEYQAASHMIQEGLVDEGIEIVEAIRNRYDGEKRNPWNEMECGSNYARSMASYSLLHAFSGFQYDMVTGMIGFRPVRTEKGIFRIVWSLAGGWGVYEQTANQVCVQLLGGELELRMLQIDEVLVSATTAVQIGDTPVEFSLLTSGIQFERRILLDMDHPLMITFER
ncbi:GH116 family glycosyl-hydrolase [Paenibacillus sp. strain BS8-2]